MPTYKKSARSVAALLNTMSTHLEAFAGHTREQLLREAALRMEEGEAAAREITVLCNRARETALLRSVPHAGMGRTNFKQTEATRGPFTGPPTNKYYEPERN